MTATVEVTISVTTEDILAGRRRERTECPVALAIIRALGAGQPGGPYLVQVIQRVWLYATPGDIGRGVPIPDDVADFIGDFDLMGPAAVEPITFTLDVPAELAQAVTA